MIKLLHTVIVISENKYSGMYGSFRSTSAYLIEETNWKI